MYGKPRMLTAKCKKAAKMDEFKQQRQVKVIAQFATAFLQPSAYIAS